MSMLKHVIATTAVSLLVPIYLIRKWACFVFRRKVKVKDLGVVVCSHVLYRSLGADHFTVLFSHVVESLKSTNTHNLNIVQRCHGSDQSESENSIGF